MFVCLGTVKTTRDGENLRESPRLASSNSPRLREEEQQVVFASQTCSSGALKGDALIDPTEQLNPNFMVPSEQPALTLVASAATVDPGRQLPSSAIATKNQVACTEPTCIVRSFASSLGNAFKYVYPHSSAPARGSINSSVEPALARTIEELRSPPVASTKPLKMGATPSAAADPPGNHRGSDGPTESACESGSETQSLWTASVHRVTHGSSTSTAGMLGDIHGRGTSRSKGNRRECDRSR